MPIARKYNIDVTHVTYAQAHPQLTSCLAGVSTGTSGFKKKQLLQSAAPRLDTIAYQRMQSRRFALFFLYFLFFTQQIGLLDHCSRLPRLRPRLPRSTPRCCGLGAYLGHGGSSHYIWPTMVAVSSLFSNKEQKARTTKMPATV